MSTGPDGGPGRTGADLPDEVLERVAEVLDGSGLTGSARSEVREELLAHFEDGLASGRDTPELLATFGGAELVSRLIASERGVPRALRSRVLHALSSIGRDARMAFRRSRRTPGFVLTAVLSLAIGIGANTAIFSLVNALLVRDLPYESPDRLYDVFLVTAGQDYGTFSYPDMADLRDGAADVVAAVAGSQLTAVQATPSGAGADALSFELVPIEAVTGDYFPGLGIKAALGRTLGPQDDVSPGAHPVVMLGWSYWREAYAGDPGVVGRDITLAGRDYTIVGVAPADFPGGLRGIVPSVFAPIMMLNALSPSEEDPYVERGNHSMFVKVRLADGATVAALESRLSILAADLVSRNVWPGDGSFRVVPTSDVVVYPPVDRFIRAAAWLLSGVVALVLLIACANLASFLLAKSVDRRREVAIQLSLGATRGALARQILIETLSLGIVAGVAGLLAAVFVLGMLVSADLPLPLPITLDLAPDATVLAFSLLISVIAGLALGVLPAILATRAEIATVLRDETPGGGQRGKVGVRGMLVAAQVAITLVLLTMAGLLLRSFSAMQMVDPGFDSGPTATVAVSLRADRWNDEDGLQLIDVLMERFRAVPGVTDVALTGRLHLDPLTNWNTGIIVDGIEPPPGRDSHSVDWTPVTPGFFDVMGIDLVEGRPFAASDRAGSADVAIINQAMADRFWPDGTALGSTFRYPSGRTLTVAGIARTAKVRSLGESPRPQFYRPMAQQYSTSFTLVANTTRDPERIAVDLARTARQLDADVLTWEPKSMARHLATQLLARRLAAWIVSAFAALALVLATIGLYGLVSYSVAQRRYEVGIRMSLGADRARVVRMLMRTGLRLVIAGVLTGLVLATAMAQLLRGLLYGVGALDAATFLAVSLVLIGVASLAAYLPARRATRIDPSSALRLG